MTKKMGMDAYLRKYIKSKKTQNRIKKVCFAEATRMVKEHFVVVAEDNVELRDLVINVPKGKSGILLLGEKAYVHGCTITGPHARLKKNKSKVGITAR